jgi:hypothetical protein
MQEPGARADQFAAIVVDAAIEVHRHLGPAFACTPASVASFTRLRSPFISSLARILASFAAWRLPQ